MILDFDEPGADSVLDADVCIVGAGAAGITLALEFLGTGHTVLVVESGGERVFNVLAFNDVVVGRKPGFGTAIRGSLPDVAMGYLCEGPRG